jgi:hypothetical protein
MILNGNEIHAPRAASFSECPGIVAFHWADTGERRFDARIVKKSKTWGNEGSDQGGETVYSFA